MNELILGKIAIAYGNEKLNWRHKMRDMNRKSRAEKTSWHDE